MQLALLASTMSTVSSLRVLVSGSGGQTGQHVFRKMLARPDQFEPVGLVRTEASRTALLASGVPSTSIVVCDVCRMGEEATAELIGSGFDALVIATSAKPAPTGETDETTGRPKFGFPNGEPREVDWLGQKAQIDLAIRCGAKHVVVCSSMGGTDPNHMLNKLGQTTNPDGTTSGGDILKWKRKAEVYLMEKCAACADVAFTIVHPGGLVNEPGGKRELVLGVDDKVVGTENRNVPREDVAEVLLQALLHPAFRDRSIDLVGKPEGDGVVTADFAALIARWLPNGESCDYALGEVAV